jgi:hypothetical protein
VVKKNEVYLPPKNLAFVNKMFNKNNNDNNKINSYKNDDDNKTNNNPIKSDNEKINNKYKNDYDKDFVECGFSGSSQDVCVSVGDVVKTLKRRLRKEKDCGGDEDRSCNGTDVVNFVISPGLYEEKRIEIDCMHIIFM